MPLARRGSRGGGAVTLSWLVLKNSMRNKRRTALTVCSIGFSIFLLIALYTFVDMLYNPPASEEAALRLAVTRSTSIAETMPLGYRQKLERVPHVTKVMPLQWFGGVYKDPKNVFANFAVDPDVFWDMFTEIKADERTKHAFSAERTAAIVGTGLMERYGWKIGDRVTLLGTIFPVDLEFKIVGTFDYDLARNNFYFRYDYFNEAMGDTSELGAFWLRADSAEAIPGIIQTVDAMFRNTPAETKTETEKAFVLNFISMIGNLKRIIGSIMAVVVFTMMLVSGSTIAMTIRERTREVAILKSIGFTQATVLRLILSEAVLIALMGVAVGIGLSLLLSTQSDKLYEATQGLIYAYMPTPATYTMAIALGIFIGVGSALFPALQASRLTILAAMRRLE